jgi:hypothetical protein
MEMSKVIEAMERLRQASLKAAFAILDYRLSQMPLEDRPDRSWEVEREEFLRNLEKR